MNESIISRCYLCHTAVDEDTWCFGCRHHICADCETQFPIGRHEPEDHSEDASDQE